MTYRILTLNAISPRGLERLPPERYQVGPDVTRPDAILLRSADLHGTPIAREVRAIGRAGAGDLVEGTGQSGALGLDTLLDLTEAADIDMLKAKIDAGATRAITQFFFDNDLYYRYLDNARAAGIDIPIVPGILPVQNFIQTKNFAARAGASVPDWLASRFEGLDEDPATRKLIAATVAAEQVMRLAEHGVSDFHFYTMNRADLAYAICHLLGLRPNDRPRADVRAETAPV